MEIVETPREMQSRALAWRREGKKTVLVPTMGYFHQGHVSLMDYGRTVGDPLVVSLFVNPTQFGPNEDLGRYPRNFERDCELAAAAGVDVIFTPSPEEMYPPGFQTYVQVEELSRGLCGASRPGHFGGVATVVLKLFNLVQPEIAIFGEKDYQQLVVLQRLARDLNLPVTVVGRPLVREADGLALSSRNTYLSPEERRRALSLVAALEAAREAVAAGDRTAAGIVAAARRVLTQTPGVEIDYVELVHPDTLERIERLEGPARLALAARLGKTRLIDNALLEV